MMIEMGLKREDILDNLYVQNLNFYRLVLLLHLFTEVIQEYPLHTKSIDQFIVGISQKGILKVAGLVAEILIIQGI